MDENDVRDLLDQLIAADAPPARVSIKAARSKGRRSLRRRRVYLPGVAAPVAAAAVAVIAGLPLTSHQSMRPGQEAEHVLPSAVARFNPLAQYVSFGWLPAGFTPGGMAIQTGSNELSLTADASPADGRALIAQVTAAGACKITGPVSGRDLKLRPLIDLGLRTNKIMALGGANCPAFDPLARRAPAVNGGAAYWSWRGELVWEYGTDAWAVLDPSRISQGSGRVLSEPHPALATWYNYPAGGFVQSAATRSLLLRVAAQLRYRVRPFQPVFGYTFTALPAGWHPAYYYSCGLCGEGGSPSVGIEPYAVIDRRIAATYWYAGPAVDPTALLIQVAPADSAGGSCEFFPGQSSHVRVDGQPALLSVRDQVGKHWQTLCVNDVDGLSVFIHLDLSIPGTADTPVPGGAALGDAQAVFGDLHLLGPDVADWTRHLPS
jgi:hypothetical protein